MEPRVHRGLLTFKPNGRWGKLSTEIGVPGVQHEGPSGHNDLQSTLLRCTCIPSRPSQRDAVHNGPFRMPLLSACLCFPHASAFRKTTHSDAALHIRTLHSHLLPRAVLPHFLHTKKACGRLRATVDLISPRCRGRRSYSMCQQADQKAGGTSPLYTFTRQAMSREQGSKRV